MSAAFILPDPSMPQIEPFLLHVSQFQRNLQIIFLQTVLFYSLCDTA